jgi:hypothetical protein
MTVAQPLPTYVKLCTAGTLYDKRTSKRLGDERTQPGGCFCETVHCRHTLRQTNYGCGIVAAYQPPELQLFLRRSTQGSGPHTAPKQKQKKNKKRQYGNKHEINNDNARKTYHSCMPQTGMPWAPPLSQKWPQDGAR